jgi:maltooligosyltrehalose trehalohydrolase
LITCIQNHDRIGNRPDGQRFGVEPGPELDQLAALLMFTSALRPLLFMGQEWGTHCRFYYFTDHQRSELIRSVRRGRAREMKAFGWKTTCPVPPDSPRAFEASRLTWGELEASGHRNVLCFYTRLIALRKAFDELGHTPAMTLDPSTGVLRMRRPKTRVFANLGKHSRRFRIEPGSRLLLASRDGVTSRSRDVELPPMTACLIERGQPGQSPRAGTKSRKRS